MHHSVEQLRETSFILHIIKTKTKKHENKSADSILNLGVTRSALGTTFCTETNIQFLSYF